MSRYWMLPILGLVFLWTLGPREACAQDPARIEGLAQAFQSQPSAPREVLQKQTGELSRAQATAEFAQELIRKNPGNAMAHYWLGAARLRLHDPIGAVQAFRSAEKLGLDTAFLHEGLGLSYQLLNQYFLFVQQMEKAAKLDPSDYKPLYYLGWYYEAVPNDFPRALAFFDRAIQLKSDDASSIVHKGYCLERMGQLRAAREYYSTAIGLQEKGHRRDSWPYQGIARTLPEDDAKEALRFAQKAVEVEPDVASNHLVLAKIDQRLGKLPEAIREARAGVKLNPSSTTARYTLSMLYREAGDRKAAQAELEMFRKLMATYGPE
jgi:tetratricopeptide (TPR) repeat protein